VLAESAVEANFWLNVGYLRYREAPGGSAWARKQERFVKEFEQGVIGHWSRRQGLTLAQFHQIVH
jgi:hypothetical protein